MSSKFSKKKGFSAIKSIIFTSLISISCGAYAEYYLVYPAPQSFAPCNYCSTHHRIRTTTHRYHQVAASSHKRIVHKRHSSYSLRVYYPAIAAPACKCEEGWTRTYCDCCTTTTTRSSTANYVTFSSRPTSSYYLGKDDRFDMGPDYDMATGDDNTKEYADMQVN